LEFDRPTKVGEDHKFKGSFVKPFVSFALCPEFLELLASRLASLRRYSDSFGCGSAALGASGEALFGCGCENSLTKRGFSAP
jgi:hypothetical protein